MKAMEFRYLGVQPRVGKREYAFSVADKESQNVVLVIDDAYFSSRQLSFQEAPDLCYQKLRTAFEAETPIRASIEITSDDLAHYRETHVHSSTRGKRNKRP
jgi:hypothetical protein